MKRLKSIAIIITIISFPLLLNGCIYLNSRPLGIETSAKSMDYSQYEELGIAEGVSSSFNLLWVIPVTDDATYEEAIAEAIRSKGADNLIGVTKWSERKVIILGTIDVLHVRGTAIRYIKSRTN
jgi:urease accessory protein UreH